VVASTSDYRLHQQLLTHNIDALAQVYDEYGPVVFGISLRVTAIRQAAEDITQEIVLDLWRRPERFDPAVGGLRPWLATVAHNRSVDWIRREQAARRRDQRHEERDHGDPVPDIDEQVQASITAERVRQAVAALPVRQRTPICLAYFAGRSYRQVAEDLDMPEGTVKSQIRAGLHHLFETMSAERISVA
jgi:RNA polymerase sigma factor (sigma-70 family)